MNDFEKAMAILETRGWIQGGFADTEGHVCAAEALRLANEERFGFNVAVVNQVLRSRNAFPDHLTGYNDQRGRTVDEMFDLLKTASDWRYHD
jgi:hypothetical protein